MFSESLVKFLKSLTTTALITFLTFQSVSPSRASSESVPLSLQDAIRLTFESNPNLSAARVRETAVQSGIGISRSQFFPRFDVEQMFIRTDQPVAAFGTLLNQGEIEQKNFNPDLLNDPDALTDHATSLVISQPIFNGGQEILGYQIARLNAEKARSETLTMTEEVLFQSIKAYLGAVLAREQMTVATEARVTAETNLAMIQSRFEQGVVVRSDVLQARVHTSEMREREISASHQYHLAHAALMVAIGPHSDVNYSASGNLDGGDCPEVGLDQLMQWAVRDRPELTAMDIDTAILGKMEQLAKAPFLPNLNVRGSYDYHGSSFMQDGQDSMTLALSLKLNLFSGTGDYHRVRQARFQHTAIQLQKAAQVDQIKLDVEKAYWDLQSATERLDVTSDAVQQAVEGLRIIENRYREGVAGILDLQRAELGVSNARFNRLSAQHDLLMGNNSLCRAVGHLYTRWLEPDRCPVPIPANVNAE